MRVLLLAILAAAAVSGQVRLMYTPEPMAVLEGAGVRKVGLWAVRMCNDGSAERTLAPERIYMAAPQLRLIGPERAAALLTDRQSRHWASRTVRVLGYAALAASLVGMARGLDGQTAGWIAIGGAAVPRIADQIRGDVPALAVFTDQLLRGPISLPPGDCGTRVMFSALMKSVSTQEVSIP